jgi:hypothetical protein
MKTASVGILACLMVACGAATAAAPSPSPTADQVTARYVAIIHDYWIQLMAADEATATFNVAAVVCLGNSSPNSPTDIANVDPVRCGERAAAILAVHQKFQGDLELTPAPPRFAADDRTIRRTLPAGIATVKALIAACVTGNKDAILAASQAYVAVMIPTFTDALDHIDPTVVHR